jgi:hypothetical protein
MQPAAPMCSTSRFTPRAQIVVAGCACACASAFLFAVDPSQHAVYPQCMLYNATGIYCAGCGATRAAYALLHGRFFDALHDNALFVVALPFILYAIVTYAAIAWQTNAWPQSYVNGRTLGRRSVVIILLLVGFMIMRNLPGWPFELLRPL